MKFISLKASGLAGLKTDIDLVFINKIIKLSGENGSGKSTVMKLLTLDSIPSDMMELDSEHYFETGKRKYFSAARKELVFEHNGVQFRTVSSFSKTGTKKAYITDLKTSVELNPNGNVTSYMNVIKSLNIQEGEIISRFKSCR